MCRCEIRSTPRLLRTFSSTVGLIDADRRADNAKDDEKSLSDKNPYLNSRFAYFCICAPLLFQRGVRFLRALLPLEGWVFRLRSAVGAVHYFRAHRPMECSPFLK
jgi:hypothetical protein